MSERPTHAPLELASRPLTIREVEDVARRAGPVTIGDEARRRLDESHRTLNEEIARRDSIYGVNTGFGSFSRTRVHGQELLEMQRNLIRSHSAGVGGPLPDEDVRAMMLLLAASLCRGHSGVRPVVVESLVAMLNAGIVPVVPEVGSVGASGDLAPLAHVASVLIGEGTARAGGSTVPGAQALAGAGIEPVALGPKEGLALINGTHLMAGRACLVLADAQRLVDGAIAAAAVSIDACRGTDAYLDPRVQRVRPHPGVDEVARRVLEQVRGSQIIPSHRENDPRVQDPYSLRCMAPVLGAAIDAIAYARGCVERELASVTDNPLVFPGADGEDAAVISAGNFHGMPLAIPLDALSIAVAHVAGISERRTYFLLAARDPQNPVNPHLSPHPGLHSGLMIVQYTAAACCNEIATLAAPASVCNIPTSAGIEDYNSFGPRAAAQARRAVDLARHVIAIELLCSCEALEYHRPLRSGAGVERTHAIVRGVVDRLTEDRSPSPDIEAIAGLIRQGAFEETGGT